LKVYLDSNILIAAFVQQHPHYEPAHFLLEKVQGTGLKPCISAHGLMEVCSVLSRTPFRPRIPLAVALDYIERSVLPWFELIVLETEDYQRALTAIRTLNITGGKIYDLLPPDLFR
jgi:predicted nucleic acid-binding protein